MNPDFDIFKLKDEDGWVHHQIRNRLFDKGIECIFVDIWLDEVAFIFGCDANQDRIALALNLHEDSVYCDYEHSLVILNLYQERHIRGLL